MHPLDSGPSQSPRGSLAGVPWAAPFFSFGKMHILKKFAPRLGKKGRRPGGSPNSTGNKINILQRQSFFFHLLSFTFIFIHCFSLFFSFLSFSFVQFLSFSSIFFHFSFSFIFFYFLSSFLSFSFIFFRSVSSIFFHFLSFSLISFHFLSFSFIFFHFLSFCRVLKI